ncbi:hypothetical protein HPB49_004111 [Dermacentor silvarum]|uniref:Uncharacterized protein n=1 Tax=Dermacentor silvarum TaxID=543639 RepID=A0ACB8DU69_DERSI|nr:hypothetical protein HPB49_004111 [Dermacentor silvarum]
MSVTMEMTVEGEDLPPEEFSPEFGWQSAVSKRMSAKVDSANRPGCGIWENRPNAGALFRTQDNGNKLKSKVIRASRMPPMPKEHAKIIIRPRGGLNIAKTGPTVIGKAIVEAAGLTPTQISSDVICPYIQQNIMVASTPNRDNASNYTRIRTLHVAGRMFQVQPNLQLDQLAEIADRVVEASPPPPLPLFVHAAGAPQPIPELASRIDEIARQVDSIQRHLNQRLTLRPGKRPQSRG